MEGMANGGRGIVKTAGAAIIAITLAACGSSSPATPTSPAPIPAADACGALGALSSTFGSSISILSGAACSADRSPVVKLNVEDSIGFAGTCSGTVIQPRVVLTAAHCIDEGVQRVRVWPGTGPEFISQSHVFYPNYRFNQSGFDVGLIFMAEDLPRPSVPILTSRDARVGETAIVAGWGRDENSITTSLRAGSTTISAVSLTYLQTRYAPPASSICSGDSGGPILLQENGAWVIGGISSATSENACNTGDNFYQTTRHPSVRDFLLQHVPAIGQR